MSEATRPVEQGPVRSVASEPEHKPAKKGSGSSFSRAITHPIGSLIAGGIVGAAISSAFAWAEAQLPNSVTLDRVIEEQRTQFANLQDTVGQLRSQASTPETRQLVEELKKNLGVHQQFVSRNQEDLKRFASEVTALREQLRQEKGFSGGADFWLGAGESMRLAGDSNVLAVTYLTSQRVDVNFNGNKQRLAIGDAVEFSDGARDCKAFVRQKPREDRRAGFDVICVSGATRV